MEEEEIFRNIKQINYINLGSIDIYVNCRFKRKLLGILMEQFFFENLDYSIIPEFDKIKIRTGIKNNTICRNIEIFILRKKIYFLEKQIKILEKSNHV